MTEEIHTLWLKLSHEEQKQFILTVLKQQPNLVKSNLYQCEWCKCMVEYAKFHSVYDTSHGNLEIAKICSNCAFYCKECEIYDSSPAGHEKCSN